MRNYSCQRWFGFFCYFFFKLFDLLFYAIFRIRIPSILKFEAKDDEVILGFTAFIITLLVVAVLGGENAYQFFVRRFGIDPGHFNALCVLSAFATVFWSFLAFLSVLLISALARSRNESTVRERAALLREIARRKRT